MWKRCKAAHAHMYGLGHSSANQSMVYLFRMPTKVCTQCCAIVNVKDSICVCGHSFVLKRKALVRATKSKRIAMKRKRALESADETAWRQRKTVLVSHKSEP